MISPAIKATGAALVVLGLAIGGVEAKVFQVPGPVFAGASDLSFLPAGQKICKVSVIYVDNNPEGAIRARLARWQFDLGEPFSDEPLILADMVTKGAQQAVRKMSAIPVDPTIDTVRSFYTWMLEDQGDTGLKFIMGFQLDVRPSCPLT